MLPVLLCAAAIVTSTPPFSVVIRPNTNTQHMLKLKNAIQSLAPVVRPEIIAEADSREIGPRRNGIPCRWLESGNLRCSSGHVMRGHATIKNEQHTGMVCAVCGKNVWTTFPEDNSTGKEAAEVNAWLKQPKK